VKILISAYGCSARGGSEGYFGWSAVQCLSRDHELWVLTGSRNEEDLKEAAEEGRVGSNLHFLYVGGPFKPWSENRLVARFQSWREYWRFSVLSLEAAKELHRKIGFDLAHHVTIATWRIPSPLWKMGIPFVFGPIGGNEKFPLRFFPLLSPKAMAFEVLRIISNAVSRLSASVRSCLRKASHVLAANRETFSLVAKIRGADSQISMLNPGFYSAALIEDFSRYASVRKMDGPLRLFAGGNLEGRKGVSLALMALARAKHQGVDFHYRLGGGGPEREYLERLAARLGLADNVIFGEALVADRYREELGATHIFLLPSLRESAGLTMMESMLAGCVPIVADCGGPAHIVTDDCGYKLSLSNPRELVNALTSLIVHIDRHREIIFSKGRAASERIASYCSEENYRQTIYRIYEIVSARDLQ
jgi:glycosyltransferase involved in cell wall biosynthesis